MLKILVRELPTVVGYHTVWQAVSADDILPQENMHLSSQNSGYGFDLYLFGEVVNSHYEKLYLTPR